MEINKQQARTMLFCMSVTDEESRLCSRDLAWAVELAKFAEMDVVAIANWQRRHDEEKAEEDYYAQEECGSEWWPLFVRK